MRTVKAWDKGTPIPPECKRLMRMVKGRELCVSEDWYGFKMYMNKLELPTGRKVSSQEILAGVALLEIQSELELKIAHKLLRYARAIARLM